MWKKLKNWMIIGLVAVMICLSSIPANANATSEMALNEFVYESDRVTWKKTGTELIVVGTFYNLSCEYDIIGLEDTVFNLVNNENEIITTLSIDTSDITVIPHSGSCTYTFTVNDANSVDGTDSVNGINRLEDVPKKYKRNSKLDTYKLTAILETASFYYAPCEGENCSYCNMVSDQKEDDEGHWIMCSLCHGTGVCKHCNGSGRKSNGRMCTSCHGSGDCSSCEGLGECELIMAGGKEYVVCRSCHGSMICQYCNGSGYSDYSSGILGRLTCGFCNGKGICSSCHGKGYTKW